MRTFTLKEIEQGTRGKLIKGSCDAQIKGVAIDSRKVTQEQLFFAIIGPNNNGHKFLKQVVQNGCKSIVISQEEWLDELGEVNAVLVEDTTEALKSLAKFYLDQLNARRIAVTGSVGKTSTRDMVYYVCKEKFKTGRNEGNLNSDYGVSMTIMGFDPDVEAIVLEIGMDHFGEIDALVKIIEPEVGIITNVGISHIENLGSREGILKAKMEITNGFGEDNTLIVNESCDLLSRENTQGIYHLKTVGNHPSSDALVSDVKDFGDEGIEYKLTIEGKEYNVRLYVPGGHNAINSALAIMAGLEIGIDVETAIKGLQSMELTGKRLLMRESHGVKVIDDTYNACPDSMKSAIKSLVATKGNRKVAVLGDMYELGPDSNLYHEDVGAFAAKEDGLDALITVGQNGKSIFDGAMAVEGTNKEIHHFDTKEDLYQQIHNMVKEGDVVLVKASRGLQAETIVDEILK